jgi:hypothetical protein
VGDLLLLDPVPLPDGLSIPAEDWHQTPTSVRRQFLFLLKQVDALEARVNQDASNTAIPVEPPRPVITGAAALAFRKQPCAHTP